MSLRSIDYAALSANSYLDLGGKSSVLVEGVNYSVMDRVDDRMTGFQAVAYRKDDTHDIVIAYRGTEFDREPIKDGLVDAAMVLGGINAQAHAAEDFTAMVMAKARSESGDLSNPPNVTVTGHSLGGTLAEINAAKFGLKGETFNAYGAAGLGMHIPEGGHQVVNHVRAGDPVSAASPHFGEVKVYAAQKDIDTLEHAGYADQGGFHNLRMALAVDFKSHTVKNFVPDNAILGSSILSPENEARYRAHHDMIDTYRHDVSQTRERASVTWEAREVVIDRVTQAGHSVSELARHGAEEAGNAIHRAAVETARVAGEVIERGNAASAVANETRRHPSALEYTEPKPIVRLDRNDHPDYALFQQAREGVHRLDAEQGRRPDELSENLAGSLTVAARRQGLTHIDHVALSDDASRSYAIQGDVNSPLKRVAEISTELGIGASIDKSSAAWQDLSAQQAHAHALAAQQTPQAPPHSAPSMGM